MRHLLSAFALGVGSLLATAAVADDAVRKGTPQERAFSFADLKVSAGDTQIEVTPVQWRSYGYRPLRPWVRPYYGYSRAYYGYYRPYYGYYRPYTYYGPRYGYYRPYTAYYGRWYR